MLKKASAFKTGWLLLLLPGMLISAAGPADTGQVTYILSVGPCSIDRTEEGDRVTIDHFGSLLIPGKPKLPRKIFSIAIPPYTRMTSVTVRPEETIALAGSFQLPPVPPRRPIGREQPDLPAKDQKTWQENYDAVYRRHLPYPESAGSFVRTAAYRRYNLVDVSIHPVTYDPLSGKLHRHARIRITVDYEPAENGYYLPLHDFHPLTEKTAGEIILNHKEARSWYPAAAGLTGKDLKDFVIITTTGLENAVSSLAAWEESKGRSVEVVTVEWIDSAYSGANQAARIRQFLREKYAASEWGIRDVLLVGHHDEVDMRTGEVSLGYGRPRTDFYYAELSLPDDQSWDLDGDGRYGETSGDQIDFYAEVNVGRIPWSDAATVQGICDKSVAFEQSTDRAFKKNILLLGSYFWTDTDNAVLMEAKVDQPWMADWTMTRMYEKNATVSSSYDCDYELTRGNVLSVWTGGRFSFINWAGHGSPGSAHQMGYSGLAFIHSSDCGQLNDDYPAIIFADACSNSDTDYDNIGRAMLKRGAVGFVGATKVALGCPGWDDPSDGSSQSLDYYFTTGVTSGDYSQGAAHRQALLTMYTNGLWDSIHYETYEWALWGNPDLRLNCAGTSDPIPLVAAPGPWANNPSDVRVYNIRDERAFLTDFQAYSADRYGVNVAVGDLDGDGHKEIVSGPGANATYGPHIRSFCLNGTPLGRVSFLAYGTRKFGVNVACGDVDGDGYSEIITGAGPGEAFGPHVRGWNFDGARVEPIHAAGFFAYGTHHFGVNVACGDVDGDGKEELLTGAGPGAAFGPHVRGWHLEPQALTAVSGINFFSYPTRHYGVRVGSGDLAGGVQDEILTGPGPGPAFGAAVHAFSCESGEARILPGGSFRAYAKEKYGVVVTGGNADDEGKDEIITGCGPGYGNFAHVRGWRFDGAGISVIPEIDFQAFDEPDVRYGVNVAIGK